MSTSRVATSAFTVSSPRDGGQSTMTYSTSAPGPAQYASIARCSRDSRATRETRSMSAPARSIVAGTQRSRGMPAAGVTTSAIGVPSTRTR